MAFATDAQRRWFFAHLATGMRRIAGKMKGARPAGIEKLEAREKRTSHDTEFARALSSSYSGEIHKLQRDPLSPYQGGWEGITGESPLDVGKMEQAQRRLEITRIKNDVKRFVAQDALDLLARSGQFEPAGIGQRKVRRQTVKSLRDAIRRARRDYGYGSK